MLCGSYPRVQAPPPCPVWSSVPSITRETESGRLPKRSLVWSVQSMAETMPFPIAFNSLRIRARVSHTANQFCLLQGVVESARR